MPPCPKSSPPPSIRRATHPRPAVKVIHETPEMLVLEDIPWLLGIGLIAFTLVPIGIGIAMVMSGEFWGLAVALGGGSFAALFFAVFVRRTRLVLDRPGDRAELKRRTVLGTKVWEWQLSEIDRAVSESSYSDGSTTYRPALTFKKGGAQAINPVYSNGRGTSRAVTAINGWLGV